MSPFFLNATLRHHISKFKDEDLEFVRKMIESFYVDDLVTGEDSTVKALPCTRSPKIDWHVEVSLCERG